jgi:diaminopimelate decarboxylase
MAVRSVDSSAIRHDPPVNRAPIWDDLRKQLLDEAGKYLTVAGEKVPTSVHIMSEPRIRHRVALWRETAGAPHLGVELTEYNAPELLKILADEPVSFHADSKAHLEMLEAVRDSRGSPLTGDRIRLTTPFNDDETWAKAAALKVDAVAISSPNGLEALIAAKAMSHWSPRIDFRLAVHVDSDPHLDRSELKALVARARAAGFERFGLAVDLQDLDYRDLDLYRDAGQRITDAATILRSEGAPVETVMLGGGFCSENLAARAAVPQSAQAHLSDVSAIVRSALNSAGLESTRVEAAGSRFVMGDKVLLSEINGTTPETIHIAASTYGVLHGVPYTGDPVLVESFPSTDDTVAKKVTCGSCDSADTLPGTYAISPTATHGSRVALFPNGREHTCAVPFNGMYDAYLVILRDDGSFNDSIYNTFPDEELANTKRFADHHLEALKPRFEQICRKARGAKGVPDIGDEAKLYAQLVSAAYEYFENKARKPDWDPHAVHYLEYIATYAHLIVQELGIRHEDLHFAIKAFPSPMVLMLLKYLGCSFDSASARERLEASWSGHALTKEVNSNPRRDRPTLRSLAEHPGAMTTVDSIEEIDRLLEAGLNPKATALGVRVAISIAQGTGNLNTKFGASLDLAETIIRYAIDKGFSKDTIYFAGHPGTQKTSGDDYRTLGNAFIELASRFAQHDEERYRFLAKTFDFGGGLPSQEMAVRAGKSLIAVLKEVGAVFKACRARYAELFRVPEESLIQKIEPGRSIVQGAWIGIRVLDVRKVNKRFIVVINCSTRGQILSGAVHDDDGFRLRMLRTSSRTAANDDRSVPWSVFGFDGALDRIANENRTGHLHYLTETLSRGDLLIVWGGDYSAGASAPIRGRPHGSSVFCFQKRTPASPQTGDPAGREIKIWEEVAYNDIKGRVRLHQNFFAPQ